MDTNQNVGIESSSPRIEPEWWGPMFRVRSSNIYAIGYDHDRGDLLVEFGRRGDTAEYRYAGVPLAVFVALLEEAVRAERREEGASVGKAINRLVKGTYKSQRVQ